jgi:hypothetical protein|tara:strand:- start:1178 stop:1699 length:522 start_codon:yes stop_codon:yes gene_type:complete
MATFDMTSSATAGVASNSIAALPASRSGLNLRIVEAILDIEKITDYSCTNGDIFQLLEIPANTMVLFAGAEVLKAFNGTSPTVDIDFAAGDDIVDGGDVTSTGFLASGSNGAAMTTSGTITFTQHVTTTDTIDVKLIASSADVTEGRLRVLAGVVDTNGAQELAVEVSRDQAS